MAFLLTCPPCWRGDCEDCIPHSGPSGLIGGVSCPCGHTDEEREQNRKHSQEVEARFYDQRKA